MKKYSSLIVPPLLAVTMLAGILAVIPLSTHAYDGDEVSINFR